MPSISDKIVKHWNFKGTHTGAFFGIPAIGNKLDLSGTTLSPCGMAERRANRTSDMKSMLDQLQPSVKSTSTTTLLGRWTFKSSQAPPRGPSSSQDGPVQLEEVHLVLEVARQQSIAEAFVVGDCVVQHADVSSALWHLPFASTISGCCEVRMA